MDLDNIQQNMNTRVVFKEPRGMIRWLQLFFAIIAFSTVADFSTTIVVDITCPQTTIVQPAPQAQPQAAAASTVAPAAPAAPAAAATNSTTATPSISSTTAAAAAPAVVVAPIVVLQQSIELHPKLTIAYPFDFGQQQLVNNCSGVNNATYTHSFSSLSGSPQFFVMTGVLSLMYASSSIVVYLFFSSTYESIPVWPVADLIIAAILCLFWFIASSSFSSGVSLLKTTTVFDPIIRQTLCPPDFLAKAGAKCLESMGPSWKALNVGLVSGFTSFFLWGAGLWFVYKETHFHTPRDTFGPR